MATINASDILCSMALSAAIYNDELPASDGDQRFFSAANGVQFLTIKKDSELYIIYRGSNEGLDWRHNLAFIPTQVPYNGVNPKILVHCGFLSGYKDGARERLHAMMPGVKRLRIAGHSYGAALSVLCAVDLQYNFPAVDIEVFLYGCPRVGNKAFMRSFNKRVPKTVRVEYGGDIVTKVPPALWGFRHVGARMRIGPCLRRHFCISTEDHYPSAYWAGLVNRQF